MDTLELSRHIGAKPYDRSRYLHAIEDTVSSGDSRVYACVSVSPNFGGSVKAYAVGCDLRCGFCWSPVRTITEVTSLGAHRTSIGKSARHVLEPLLAANGQSLDDVLSVEKALVEIWPRLFSSEEIVDRMIRAASERTIEGIGSFELCTEGTVPDEIHYYTISGGEPTVGRPHLLGVLDAFFHRNVGTKFLLQSHGFILGADPSYLQELARFRSCLEVRLSLKAGSPEGLATRAGVSPADFELPFRAVSQLLDLGFDFYLAAMSDPSVMPSAERDLLLSNVAQICKSKGKTLCLMDDCYDSQDRDRTLMNLGNQCVFLEEERYIPAFPQILAAHGI